MAVHGKKPLFCSDLIEMRGAYIYPISVLDFRSIKLPSLFYMNANNSLTRPLFSYS